MDDRAVVVRRVLRGPDGRRLGLPAELNALQGTWKAVSGQAGGKPLSETELAEHDEAFPLTFDGYDLRFSYAMELPFAIEVAASKTPKELTIYTDAEGESALAKCIYTIEHDRLKICWGLEKERPTEFKTTEKDGFVLVVYRRADSTRNQESRATAPGH